MQLLQLFSLAQPGMLDRQVAAPVACHKYILDLSCRVQEGKHVEGALAVGSFAQQLLPLVVLHKAELPV